MISNLLGSVVGRPRRAQRPIPSYLSLVDFGADRVKASVVQLDGTRVRILGYGMVETGGRSLGLGGGRAAVSSLTELAEEALVRAEDQSASDGKPKVVPDDAVFSIPARFTMGQNFRVSQTRPDSKAPITPRELKNAWERVERQARERLPEVDADGISWKPLGVASGIVAVDGNQVTDPVGLKGRVLSVSVFGLAVWPSVLRASGAVAERLGVTLIDLVDSCVALSHLVPRRDAILIDVGWQGTSLGLVRQGGLVASQWVGVGGDSFTRSLADAFGCSLEDAEALKQAHAGGILSEQDQKLVTRPLAGSLAEWVDLVEDGLSRLASGDSASRLSLDGQHALDRAEQNRSFPIGNGGDALPGRIYLTGGGSVLPGLVAALGSIESNTSLNFQSAVELESLGRQIGSRMSDRPSLLDVPPYPLSDLLAPVLSLAACVPVDWIRNQGQ